MRFDSSRFTSDAWNNFVGVVMQQGRVQLDSDWNEWLAEFTRRVQAETLDVVGQAGVPSITPDGFKIGPNTVAGKISVNIGPGRMYVDGILAENHGLPEPNPAKWIPGPGAAPEVKYPGWDTSLDELRGADWVDYNSQPYYPNPAPFPQTGGPYLMYLDLWQREVTFLQDPDLVEKAVGVDTTGRLQSVWQGKWMDVSGVTGLTCKTDIPGWDKLLLPPGPRLTTGVVQSSQGGPCCLTPNTGYTGLENQLYRVEIHQPGSAGTATFKWSRDNASVATGVTAITQGGKLLTVQSTGKDAVLRFSPNDWVEITDDYLELNGLPGELHQVLFVSDSAKTITRATPVLASNFPVDSNGQADSGRHTRLTRWNQGGTVYESDNTTVWVDLNAAGSTGDIKVPPPGTALVLENGITVAFDSVSPGTPFESGHCWTLAARTADGTVEYLDKAPPRGIYHHYARLALVTLPSTIHDCRVVFPPLTGLEPGGCCCCSVTVGDGVVSQGDFSDIQTAINSLPVGTTAVEVCLLPGSYSPSATVTIARSNLTIRGCPQAKVQFSGSGPVFQAAPAGSGASVSQVAFDSLNVKAPSMVVQVTLGAQIAIRNCVFTSNTGTGDFAVIAQSSGIEVRGHEFSGGGVWALDGSSQVFIRDNVMANSSGPGILLGGFPSGIDPAPKDTGVVTAEITGNQITGAGNSGISTVLDAANQPVALGDIEDLLIEGNRISDCAQLAPTLPYFSTAVAGILLHHANNVSIHDNEITGNGSANNVPACGVFVANVSDLDISNNRILDNGVGPKAEPPSHGQQAGINATVIGKGGTGCLRIHHNEIRMPAGPALKIKGKGPMSVIGNNLQSFGLWPRNLTYGLAVLIENLGFPLELGAAAVGALAGATGQPAAGAVATDPSLLDGRTLFESNQVTYVSDAQIALFPCVLLSMDDLAIQHNQFVATAQGIYADVYALALFSLRSRGNRFSELPGSALTSHLAGGLFNIVDENQATHCVVAFGTNTMPGTTNQIMGGTVISEFCSGITGQMRKTFGGQ